MDLNTGSWKFWNSKSNSKD